MFFFIPLVIILQIPIVSLVLALNIRRYCCNPPSDKSFITVLNRSNYVDLDAGESLTCMPIPLFCNIVLLYFMT